MLDRSTSNLFEAEPPDASGEPEPTLFQEAGTPAAPPTPPPARRPRATFSFPRFGARLKNRSGAGWRNARHFLTSLLIILAVSRLAAGGCSSTSAPTPSAGPARSLLVQVKRVPAQVHHDRHGGTHRPQIRRFQKSRKPILATATATRPSPVASTPARGTIAAPTGVTPAAEPAAAAPSKGQEFGFEH